MSECLRKLIGLELTLLVKVLAEGGKIQRNVKYEKLDDGQLLELYENYDDYRSKLLKRFSKLEKLHHDWIRLMNVDAKEEKEFENYVKAKGDFREELTKASALLTEIDGYMDTTSDFLKKRGIEFEKTHGSTISEKAKKVTGREDIKPQEMKYKHPLEFLTRRVCERKEQLKIGEVNEHVASQDGLSIFDASLLSRLELPKFSGQILEFPEFWERFNTLVHSKKTIDQASKFSLLKSCLTNYALNTVSCLPVTSANYEIAVSILLSKYYDIPTIRHKLYTKLAELPSVTNEGPELYNLYLQMTQLVGQYSYLQNSGIESEYGLGAVLFNKLPFTTRGKIYDRNSSSENLSPVELLKILHGIVHKSFVLNEMCPEKEKENTNRQEGQTFAVHSVCEEKMSKASDARKFIENETSCIFCYEKHKFLLCGIDVQTRVNIIKEQRKCFNCLEGGHNVSNCTRGEVCHFCCKRHHTSLCYQLERTKKDLKKKETKETEKNKKEKKIKVATVKFVDTVKEVGQNVDESKIHEEKESIQATEICDEIPTLLCKEVDVFNPDEPQRKEKVLVMLDSGASDSYINERLAEKFCLQTDSVVNLEMKSFGNNIVNRNTNVHKVRLKLENCELFEMKVHSVPQIGNKVPYWDRKKNALAYGDPMILIGNDYMWKFLDGPECKIKCLGNEVRLETKLGSLCARTSRERLRIPQAPHHL